MFVANFVSGIQQKNVNTDNFFYFLSLLKHTFCVLKSGFDFTRVASSRCFFREHTSEGGGGGMLPMAGA